MADTSSAYEDSTVYDWPKILGQKDKECSKEIEKDNEKNKTIDTEADIVDSSSCEDPIPLISNAIAASFREQLGKSKISSIFFLRSIVKENYFAHLNFDSKLSNISTSVSYTHLTLPTIYSV